MISAIRRHATIRNLIAVLAAIGLLALISHGLVLPAYRAVASGLDPFDVQSTLTREMVAIQRGAFGLGVRQAYLSFTVLDVVSQALIALFYALLWAWIMAKSPQPLARGSILLIPFLGLLCDLAEHAGVLILVFSDAHTPYHDLTTATLMVHRAKFFLRDVVNLAITLPLAGFTVYFRSRAPTVRKTD